MLANKSFLIPKTCLAFLLLVLVLKIPNGIDYFRYSFPSLKELVSQENLFIYSSWYSAPHYVVADSCHKASILSVINNPELARMSIRHAAEINILCARWSEAEELLSGCYDACEGDVLGTYLKGIVAYKNSDFQGAAKYWGENDIIIDQVVWIANNLLDLNQQDKAIELFQVALAANPANSAAYIGLGRAHWSKAEWDLAAVAFSEANQLDPENIEALLNYTKATLKLGQELPEAEQIFKQALENSPDNVWLYGDLAFYYVEKDEHLKAIELLEEAHKKFPERYIPELMLGNVYSSMGRKQDALGWFHKAYVKGDKTGQAAYEISRLHFDNQPEIALNFALIAVKADPLEILYKYSLVDIYVRMNKCDEATLIIDSIQELPQYDHTAWVSYSQRVLNECR